MAQCLPDSATHSCTDCCNTLQHTATHCNTIRDSATHPCTDCCNTLQHTATHCNTMQHNAPQCETQRHTHALVAETHCNTLQHMHTCVQVPELEAWNDEDTATVSNTPIHLLQHTATHCNTLQHTATYCNTPQHTATHARMCRCRGLMRGVMTTCYHSATRPSICTCLKHASCEADRKVC